MVYHVISTINHRFFSAIVEPYYSTVHAIAPLDWRPHPVGTIGGVGGPSGKPARLDTTVGAGWGSRKHAMLHP